MNKELVDLIDFIESNKTKYPMDDKQLSYFKSLDVYDSVHIEGNTLSRNAITVFLETGITVHGKPLNEFLEVKNYHKALDLLKVNLVNETFELTPMFIRQLHKLVSNGLLEEQYCGNFRDDQVYLKGSTYLPPFYEDVPALVEELCNQYNSWSEDSIETKFELIIKTFRTLESIHPFFDGNGRTGRLLMNYLLLKNGYPFLWINAEKREQYLDCFEHYEQCLFFHAQEMKEMYQFLLKTKKRKE